MLECIPDCFPSDPVNLIQEHWIELRPRVDSLYRERDRLQPRELVSVLSKRFRQFLKGLRIGTNVPDVIASFCQNLVCVVEPFFQHYPVGILAGRAFCGYLEPEYNCLEILQQRIMKFPCDAHALVHLSEDPDTKLFCDLAHAIAISRPDCKKRRQNICSSEPPCVPPGRQDDDLKFCSGIAPSAAVRRTLYMKAIRSGGQSAVGHGAAVTANLRPRIVQILEPVTIAIGRRIGIRKCCEGQRERCLLV